MVQPLQPVLHPKRLTADSANAGDVKAYTLHVPYNKFKQESGKREAVQRFVAAI